MSNSETNPPKGSIRFLDHLIDPETKGVSKARIKILESLYGKEDGIDTDVASDTAIEEKEKLELTIDEIAILLSLARFGVLGIDYAPKGEKKEYKFGDYMVRHSVKTMLGRIDGRDNRAWRKENKRNRKGSVIYTKDQIGIILDELQFRHDNSKNDSGVDREIGEIGLVPEVIEFAKEISQTYSAEEIKDGYYYLIGKVEQGELM